MWIVANGGDLESNDTGLISSIRTEINLLKLNKKNHKMEAEYCNEKCEEELDNKHMT